MITDAHSPSARQRSPRLAGRSFLAVAAVAVVGLIAAACGSTSPQAQNNPPTTLPRSPAGATVGTTEPTGTTVVNAVSNTGIGSSILVTTSGMTLYTLSADTNGMSACSTACAAAWPPLTVASGVTPIGDRGTGGTLATITRSDGSRQVTFDGHPLYTFVGDRSAGTTTGNGIKSFGGTWSVVKVGSATSSGAATTTPAPMTTTTKAPSGGGYGY